MMLSKSGMSFTFTLAVLLVTIHASAAEPLRLDLTEHSDVRHVFTGLDKSYGATITNLTERTVTIDPAILIEHRTAKGWKQETAIQAVANCTNYDQRDSSKAAIGREVYTSLAAHTSLSFVPWDGFLCAGQCSDACKQNGRVRPGIYRFIVVVVPDGKRIASQPFTIPRW